MPLAPLFSPVYSTTRPYSQTKSNTQRDLMLPDEILRLDRARCIALFQGHKPALLYKLSPEDLPGYADLRSRRIIDYIPAWKMEEQEKNAANGARARGADAERYEWAKEEFDHPSSGQIQKSSPEHERDKPTEAVVQESSLYSVLGMDEDEEDE